MRSLWLLLLLGFARSPFSMAGDGLGPSQKKPKRPKIKEENNILVLNKGNFNRALNETKYLLVEFYITLSGPSQTLAVEFAKAAKELKKEAVDVRLGKVDVTEQKDLKKEFDIQEYPTLKFFINGDRKNPIDCKGVREAAGFVTWVQRQIGPSTVLLNSTDQAEAFLDPEDLAVIGFFKSLQGEAVEVFSDSARDIPELSFGLTTSEEVFIHFGVREDMVVIFQKGKPVHNEAPIEGNLNRLALTRLIKTFTMDLVTEYNLETSVKVFDVPVEHHIVLFIPKSSASFNKTYDNFLSAAPEFRGKIMFILVDTDETRNGRVIEYFRVTEVEVPAVQILNLTSDARYKLPAEEVTTDNLRRFCRSYLEGTAKRYFSSEEIPEGWDKLPVKVLVGKNFNRVAFNDKNHVFVMFYAPWCHECQKLLPIWEELGEMFEDRKNVVVAKIDIAANEVLLTNMEHYPFFRYFPAGSETEVVAYRGERTLDGFAEYLEEQIQARKKDPQETVLNGEAKVTPKEEL